MSMIIKHYGGFINHVRLSYLTNITKNGTTAYDIVEAFKALGFNSYGIRYDLNKHAAKINLPAIAHTVINKSYNHFVVIYEINFEKEYLIVADPASKIKKMSFDSFNEIFTNVILIAYPIRKIEKEVNIKIIKYLRKFIKFKNIFPSLILLIVSFIISIIYISFLKLLINKLNKKYLICLIILLLLKYILNKLKNKKILNLKINADFSLMKESFEDIIDLPYSYYRSHTTGEIVSRLNDIDNIKDIIDVILILISDLIVILFVGTILFLINKILFLSILFIVILYALNYISHFKKQKNLMQNLKQAKALLTSYETESIIGFESIKGQNFEEIFKEKYKIKAKYYLDSLKNYQSVLDSINNINECISDMSMILIISIGICFINNGLLSYSDLVIFYALSNYFINPVFNITSLLLLVNEIKISINRLIELKCKKIIKNGYEYNDLLINNLTYFNKDKIVLEDIKLKIKTGDNLALTGKSGCGKSTFLKILKQYYETKDIFIGNYNISDINLKEHITYISQDEYLFTDTLLNNILLGSDFDEDRFNKIVDTCGLKKIIKDNKLGVNMLLEENGFNLSGGERQRIILARALYHIKDFLFIDEGLSEVDIHMERSILKKIINRFSDKTFIFVTHRKSNLDLFNRVINMSK